MEIHAPEGRIESIRDFLHHMATIVVGILIALSLEALVEWRHEANQVKEAKASMESEIRDNRGDLTSMLASLPRTKSEIGRSLETIDRMLERPDNQPRPDDAVGFTKVTVGLNSTARSTAEAIGALGHMDYAEVKRFAEAYEYQKEFMQLHARLEELYIVSGLGDETALAKQTSAGLQTWRQNLITTLKYVAAIGSKAKTLTDLYDKALASE
jgi:hypothetical protein